MKYRLQVSEDGKVFRDTGRYFLSKSAIRTYLDETYASNHYDWRVGFEFRTRNGHLSQEGKFYRIVGKDNQVPKP